MLSHKSDEFKNPLYIITNAAVITVITVAKGFLWHPRTQFRKRGRTGEAPYLQNRLAHRRRRPRSIR